MGGDGNDVIYGNAGADTLFGLDGNDRMFGGQGIDHLVGGNGDDAIHGGELSSADTMLGNAGNDRFLHQSNDVVYDQTVGDALIEFEDFTDSWTDLEIEVVDRGFNELYLATGNNVLLFDTLSSDDLRFLKYADLGGSWGINYLSTTTSWYWENGQQIFSYQYDREIRIVDWDESSQWYNDQFVMTTIHEIGHNWDSDLELESVAPVLGDVWESFLAISGWTDVNPNNSSYTLSSDGQWWYLNDASFAENYGRSNPYEDLATMWEYLFTTDPADYDPDLQPKLDIYSTVFSLLS
jgi:predicted Zn-dependent protease with MMP-like domain